MSFFRLSAFAVLPLTLALAACGSSDPNWRNAGGADDGRLRADYAYCKRYADDEAMRKSGAIHGEDISGINSSTSPTAQMAAYDAKRIYKRALNSCMTGRGYSKGKSATSGVDNAVEGVREKLRW
jgi:hypothetical protein